MYICNQWAFHSCYMLLTVKIRNWHLLNSYQNLQHCYRYHHQLPVPLCPLISYSNQTLLNNLKSLPASRPSSTPPIQHFLVLPRARVCVLWCKWYCWLKQLSSEPCEVGDVIGTDAWAMPMSTVTSDWSTLAAASVASFDDGRYMSHWSSDRSQHAYRPAIFMYRTPGAVQHNKQHIVETHQYTVA